MLRDAWARNPLGLYLPRRPSKADLYERPVAVDLFAGTGGFSLGFDEAGFHVAAALEWDAAAAITYMANLARPGVRIHFDTDGSRQRLERVIEQEWGLRGRGKRESGEVAAPRAVAGSGWISSQPSHVRGCEQFFFGDVRNFTGRQILEALGLGVGEIDVVFGGPPCQGFSTAGRRNVHDPHNSMVFEFARLVVEMRPAAFVMENVAGMVSMVTPEGVPVVDELAAYLQSGGLGTAKSIRAALEGHPQARVVRRERPTGRKGEAKPRPGLDRRAAEQQELFA